MFFPFEDSFHKLCIFCFYPICQDLSPQRLAVGEAGMFWTAVSLTWIWGILFLKNIETASSLLEKKRQILNKILSAFGLYILPVLNVRP